jgi:dolichyl-phosphate mannosyltransferase polypeptide 3
VLFGAYSLSSLGLGLLRFNDCPEAYESLLKEITQAKNELRDQGVAVD